MAIVIYNDNGTIKVVKLGTYVVSTDANATESYTITWKAYDGTTLKTETKDYGSTSTAPIGTTDTVQYDYSWPQNSVVVTGPQTIQETRTIKSYTITWYFYNGAVARQDNLTYGSTSTAPTGTTDTAQYQYDWPKSSTSVTGNETIQETRATKSYTITWKAYDGATLKSETLLYGETAYAPTGTPEDSDWYYYWPQNSVVVTGPQTIQEARTTITSYTITWYFYNGAVARQDYLAYGETSAAPTGTTDTAQYDYSWPKSSTSVTGNETIQETRATKSYGITWKAHNNTTLKSETLLYGETAYAPTGTPEDSDWYYYWPQNSVVVTGPQTIQEARTELYTITWKAYNGATLKTENLIYGATSTAPTGTADTAQYDYEWPKLSTSVTGNETIQETRTTKSYEITWKAYNGAILKSETLLYDETAYAPTGTPEDSDWYYYWPQNSVVVTGPQTIQEARTTITSYTIIWKSYTGATLKTENLIYGATSTAPTGTADTAQYDYEWPKLSTSVTGNETIQETRTELYTITWKAYNGAILKSETLLYGETSTAPTGTSDTTQYDYSWPKLSTSVTGNETITETRTELYTITWKAYNGAILKSETLLYGDTAIAPTGTSDTTQYDYSWPKSSTTVTGNETITETRIAKYTIIWKSYTGATLKTDYLIYGETSAAPTGTPDDSTWDYYWPQNSVVVTGPQTIQEARRQIQRLSSPQGSLTDKFDYLDGASILGGVMIIGLYNSNNEGVTLNGRILFGSQDMTSQFTHFSDGGYYFFGDGFPPNTGLTDGLSVISGGLLTSEWLYPVTVEVWFEPAYNDSTYSTSDKLIITVNS